MCLVLALGLLLGSQFGSRNVLGSLTGGKVCGSSGVSSSKGSRCVVAGLPVKTVLRGRRCRWVVALLLHLSTAL
jgi:hypothetical protein